MYIVADEFGYKTNNQCDNENIVMFTSIKNIDKQLVFNNFSIKYVISGEETYNINGVDYVLKKNDYVLCNQFCEGKVFINSPNSVKGICIDISPDLVAEVLASYHAPDTNIPDLNLGNYFNSSNFMEQQFSSSNINFGRKLIQLENILSKKPHEDHIFNKEFYYRLIEDIIADYIPLVKQFQSLRSIKSSTKKDLLRKLSLGKSFIDENFYSDIQIVDIAATAHISQYHFFRLFRNVYNISPLQYLIKKRMEKAQELLLKMPINQIALELGYQDIFSFSKAYKKFYGIAPSKTIL